jgi:ribosome-binding factor A
MLRSEQLEDRIHFALSTFIQRELRDPDLGFLTVTAVRLTRDRSIARIYYTVLNDEEDQSRSHKALERASGFLRSHLAKSFKMRRVPELQFFRDQTLEHGNRIEDIFAKIKEESESQVAQLDGALIDSNEERN